MRTPPLDCRAACVLPCTRLLADARERRRWPFLVGFTVTGGIFLKIALGITGALRCLQAVRCLPCRGRALPALPRPCAACPALPPLTARACCVRADEEVKKSSARPRPCFHLVQLRACADCPLESLQRSY